MTEVYIERELLGCAVWAKSLWLDNGIQVTICGGCRTHVGSVSVVWENGENTVELPGHRDSTISRRWAEILYEAFHCPVSVTCGIHYDGISQNEISAVISESEDMLEELQRKLRDMM